MQLPQTINQSLLHGGRKTVEARLFAQSMLLRLERKVLVMPQPLTEMLFGALTRLSTLSGRSGVVISPSSKTHGRRILRYAVECQTGG